MARRAIWGKKKPKPADPVSQLERLRKRYKTLEEKMKKLQTENECMRECNLREMEHRRVVMEELMDKINVLRREFGDTNARLMEDVEFATNKNIKLEREKKRRILEIMRKDQKILRLRASVSDEKIEKFIEKEHKKTDVLHKSMMEAQKEILRRQEEQDGEMKPWRKCGICFEEYEEELEHSPRVLECGHTVCYRCLWKMADPDGVLCPFDRITTICRKRNLRLLPKNFAVLQM